MRVAALVALVAPACVPDRELAKVDEECRESMSEVVYRHACQHGQLGPYEAVDAVAAREGPIPIVDGAQRVLDVKLPAEGASADADGVSYLTYVATRDGEHAMFAGAEYAAVAIAVSRDGARLLGTPLEPMPDRAACGGMVEVTGFTFEAGAHYLFELGPATAPALRLFIDHLATFGEAWSDRCID